MTRLALITLTCSLFGMPAPVAGQSILELLRSISQGGGWIQIPVAEGRGSLRTGVLPTMGLSLDACFQVYPLISGEWDITLREPIGDGLVHAKVPGGESVPFQYQTGAQAQLTVDVQWSEPRDTTLIAWVGVRTPAVDRDPCEPVYATGRD